MPVYVVTQNAALLRYNAPVGSQIWLKTLDTHYKIYYKNCKCKECDEHEILIAWVQKTGLIAIGFEEPVCVQGRMLTSQERSKLERLLGWLERKRLPRKIELEPLRQVLGIRKP